MAGAEEGHDLVAHGFKGEFVARGGSGLHVVADDEGDDVFVFGVGDGLFFFDDFGGFAEDDVAGREHVAVHFGGEIFGERDESGETVEDTGADIERKDKTVRLSNWRFGVFKGIEIGPKASFTDDIEGGAVQPFQDFKRLALNTFGSHGLFPKIRQKKRLALEDWRESADRLDRKARRECLSLTNMSISLCQQNTLAQNSNHPLLGSVWLWVVVRVLDGHLLESLIVGNRQTLGAEREEIPYNRAVGLVPVALGKTDFLGDDGGELAPEREPRDRGNLAEFRNIERVDIRNPDEPNGKSNGRGIRQCNSGNNVRDSGNKQSSDGRGQQQRHQCYLDGHDERVVSVCRGVGEA